MPLSNAASLTIWSISAATIAAILLRPRRIGEWVWALLGAAILVAAGLLPARDAANAAADGLDVYLFLGGMLALAELARIHGVFEWLAGLVLERNIGAPAARMFAWTYAAGVAITAVLSNDGTILLLTPAALAVAKRARLQALPLLFASAFVANAASFVLPVSNPANLVLFRRLPTLGPWIAAFGFASLASIGATYLLLRYAMRRELCSRVEPDGEPAVLTQSGKAALVTVTISSVLVILAAAFERPVGATAAIVAAASVVIVAFFDRTTVARVVRESAWSIVPLVAGLFVLVRALDRTGILKYTRTLFHYAGTIAGAKGSLLAGGAVAIADNILNNLPVGVFARYSVHGGVPPQISHAALVGLDLGPNLSVTGSLATLLWLMLLRREGIEITPWQFLRTGAAVMIPALLLALLAVH